MQKNKELSEREITVILALLAFKGKAITDQLVDLLKISKGYLINVLTSLRKKKIITSLRASEVKAGVILGSPILNSSISKILNPKQRVHFLTMDLPQLLERYPEILKWTKFTLGVSSEEELKEHLEKIRKNI